jgi:hypothetical protein
MGVAEVSAIAAAVSAGVAVVGGVVSVVAWLKARGERREAATQAKLATSAAIASEGHLDRIADVQVQQHETNTALRTAQERDPWQLQRISSNEANLYNDTSTAKHNVKIEIEAGGTEVEGPGTAWSKETIRFVGPHRAVPIEFMDVGMPMSATITWHMDKDRNDDPPPPQIIRW